MLTSWHTSVDLVESGEVKNSGLGLLRRLTTYEQPPALAGGKTRGGLLSGI